LTPGGHTLVHGQAPRAPVCPVCGTSGGRFPFCPADGQVLVPGFELANGRYRIDELVGAGAQSFVFGGRHQALDGPVAVKLLRPARGGRSGSRSRFLRGARSAARLSHPNVVRILDYGDDPALGLPFLVTERVWGESLASRLLNQGPMPWQVAIPLLMQLAAALEHAHQSQVLHRDVSPGNVLLADGTQGLQVKLSDFGLARSATPAADAAALTAPGATVGTPAYLSPEAIRGEPVDARSDLYSFGATAYELLAGSLSHAGETPVAVLAEKLSEAPRPMAQASPGLEVPEAVESIVARCLSIDPALRPQSAAELRTELARLIDGRAGGGESLVAGTTVGRYRIAEPLGTGGAATVFRAEHTVLGINAAVKLLRPEVAAAPGGVERFVQEIRAAAELDSAHVPRYFDFGYLDDGRPYAVLEFLRGETLAGFLERRGPLDVETTATLLEQVARTMAVAHRRGIVHRDLKLENLFVVDAGAPAPRVKILDFGIARVAGAGEGARLTSHGEFLGTPGYCAPEQVYGDADDPAVDIYALGVCGFAMLAGRLPFEGPPAQMLADKTHDAAPGLDEVRRDVPNAATALIGAMLERDPGRRPPTMEAVVEGLASWRTVVRSPPTPSPPASTRSRRWIWGTLPLAAAAVALFVARGAQSGAADAPRAIDTSGAPNEARTRALPAAMMPAATETPRSVSPVPASPPQAPPAGSAPGQPSLEDGDDGPPEAKAPEASPKRRKRAARPRRRAKATPSTRAAGAAEREPGLADDVVIADPFE